LCIQVAARAAVTAPLADWEASVLAQVRTQVAAGKVKKEGGAVFKALSDACLLADYQKIPTAGRCEITRQPGGTDQKTPQAQKASWKMLSPSWNSCQLPRNQFKTTQPTRRRTAGTGNNCLPGNPVGRIAPSPAAQGKLR